MTHPRSLSPEWDWLWRQVRPFAPYQAASLACAIIASAVGLSGPLLIKWLLDDVLPTRRWQALGVAAAAIFGTSVLRLLFSSAGSFINTLAVQRLVLHIRTRLVRHLQSLPATFYATHPVGDLTQRVERDVTLVGELGSDVLPSLVRIVIETVMTVVVLVMLDWRLACVVVPLPPLLAYVRHWYRDELQLRAEEVRLATGRQSSLLNEVLTGVTQVQLLGAERRFTYRYKRLGRSAMERTMFQRRQELIFGLLSSAIIGFGIATIVGYGGMRVMRGTLTPGGLVAFYAYLGAIFLPLNTAVELYSRLDRVRASIRRVMEIEQAPEEAKEERGGPRLPVPPRVLACRGVRFAYDETRPTLDGIDCELRAGERVALVGESGSGKSSLLKLIPRLYETTGGEIEVDGRNLRSVPVRSLRRAIAFVSQEPVLFQGTLFENLRHGQPLATVEEVERAVWISCLREVIDKLPDGWHTPLGPTGQGLSGGERQRLAIARAVLQRRPVLILDEATSALDAPTEHRLLSRLGIWSAGRIVVLVSHRLAAARWADRVLVLHRGRVIEDAPHDVLYRPGTHYYALWQRTDTREVQERLS